MDEFRTERLLVRAPRPTDVDALHALVSDYEVVKFTGTWPYPAERGFTASRCMPADCAKGLSMLVFLGPELIGAIGGIAGTLGYMFAKKHWGNGYATEGCRAVVAHSFQRQDIEHIHACIWDENPASGRVLEKIGFSSVGKSTYTSKAQGRELSSVEYQLTRAEWVEASPYEVTTDRLILRSLRDEDWNDVQRLGGVREVARMMTSVRTPWQEADVKAWLKKSKWQGRLGFRPAVTLKDGTLIGTLGIGTLGNAGDPLSCAYFIGQDYWGRGYATEAMRAFLADSFQRFDLTEIEAAHFVDNPASGRVLTKLGFERIGAGTATSAGRLEDAAEYLYRLTRDQFGTDT